MLVCRRLSPIFVAACLAMMGAAAQAEDLPPLTAESLEPGAIDAFEPPAGEEQSSDGEPCLERLACRHRRAGCPLCIAPWAQPSYTSRETGYYVGGGAAFLGQPRCLDEGTWGWDYLGVVPKRVVLGWWHGRRYQGGFGSYRTDGPRLVHH